MTRTLVLPLLVAAAGAFAACVSPVPSQSAPCPCAGNNVCCPSGLCAPDLASCDHGSSTTLATAPVGLNFVRLDATTGRFSWDPVRGATEYVLFANGAPAKTMADTQADLDIGPGMVEVTVAAQNLQGMSPISSPFPVLFDVRLRACSSMTASVTWSTQGPTDTQLATEGASESPITCFDPTPRTQHHYGEISSCMTPAMPRSYGSLTVGATATVTMLSRDELGFLGEYQLPLQLPPSSCLCVANPNNPDIVCEAQWPGISGCSAGFNLETGAAASIDDADVYLQGIESSDGIHLDEARIVAPNGLVVLKNHGLCDIDEAPAEPYVTSTLFEKTLPTDLSPAPLGQSDSLVVKTKSGRYAKLMVLCNCPSGGDNDPDDSSKTHLLLSGFYFSWILAPEGTPVFDQ